MNRRLFLALAVAAAGSARAQPYSVQPDFVTWLEAFRARATASGLPQSVVERELGGLTPDPVVVALDGRQPEFARPVSAYVAGAISPARVETGRAERDIIGAFPQIEQRFGVPREVLIGVWAMESAYGARQGDMDVIRCLATLAPGRRRAWAEDQILAALRMIADGDVARSQLRGSWAGAMGQTQILPSTYLSSGVSAAGGRRPDIWNSPADALATAANLLSQAGWRRGEGWAQEVILPAGFDVGLSEGPVQPLSWWRDRGVRLGLGAVSRPNDAEAAGMLLLPSGAQGPAFLALPNHFVIRSYNDSIAYALAVGLLADRIAGGGGLETPWPRETPLSLAERVTAQTDLTRLGFSPGLADGMIGVGTRQALRAWQRSQGLPADGYLSPLMVERLGMAAARA